MPGAAMVAPMELLFFTFFDFYKRAGPTALSLSELGFLGCAECLGWEPDNGVAVARL